MKKIFTLLLLTIVAAVNAWGYDFEYNGLYYAIINDTVAPYEVEVSSVQSPHAQYIEIPDIIEIDNINYHVTGIGDEAFADCSDITSITIPDGVTYIGNMTFNNCSGLTSIILPEGVTSLGYWAFWNCSGLTSITIPESATNIGAGAFEGCSGLTSITIPESVTSIGDCTFWGCSGLTSITIPESVTSLGWEAFWGCSGLTSITIPESVTSIGGRAFSGCSGLTSITIPESVTSIEWETFSGCSGLTSITIPESVTSIGEWAFQDCSGLTAITIPESVTSIGDYTFYGCSGLTAITIPERVTHIGEGAFLGCSGLASVTIPDGVTTIDKDAFCHCTGLTSVTIPDGVTTIGESAFYNVFNIVYHGSATGSPWGARSINGYVEGYFVYDSEAKTILLTCSPSVIGEIILPESVTSIGDQAFYLCSSLTSIILPDGVTSIGDQAFLGCSGLTSITIPDGVTSIGSWAFSSCTGLTSITIGNGVTSIGDGAFFYCSGLTSITIPDGVTSIGRSAFYNCSALTSITIGNGVTSIGEEAFYWCSSLTSIVVRAEVPPSLGSSVFPTYAIPVYIPCGSLSAYQTAEGWNNFSDFREPPVYEVYVRSSDEEKGIVQVERERDCSPTAILSAIGNPGYQFVQWSDGNTDNPRTMYIEGDVDLEAYFDIQMCSVNIGYDGGQGSVSGGGTYTYGSEVRLEAVANTGYRFTQWSDGNTDNPRLIFVESDVDLEAYFEPLMYNVNVNCDGGQGSVSGGGTYAYGSKVWLKAVANIGYRFTQWSDGNTDNPRLIYVEGDVDLEAYFETATYSVSIGCDEEQGTVFGSGTYARGEQVTIGAIANAGYRFIEWSDGNTDNPRTIYVEGDVDLQAYFGSATYSVSIGCDAEQGSVFGSGTYAYGTEVTVGAIANAGYRFTQWSDGNTDNPRTIYVEGDVDLQAHFEAETYSVNVECDPAQGTVFGSGTYIYGAEVTIGAIANTGYRFKQWDDGNTDNPRKLLVVSEVHISAVFEQVTGIEQTSADEPSAQKILRDGHVLIIRDGKTYSVLGEKLN